MGRNLSYIGFCARRHSGAILPISLLRSDFFTIDLILTTALLSPAISLIGD